MPFWSLLKGRRCLCRPSGALKSPTRFWLVNAGNRWTQPEIKQFTTLLESLSFLQDTRDVAKHVNYVLPLARMHGLSAYDAAYLELSIRNGAPLATLDDKLRRAAKAAGITLFEGKASQ